MKIRTRLILAFLALGLMAALSVGVLSLYATRGLFAEYAGGQRAARLAQWRDIMAGYYDQTGSWNGVQAILAARNAAAGNGGPGHWGMGGMGGGMGMGGGNQTNYPAMSDSLVLTDAGGTVIAGALPAGQQLAPRIVGTGLDVVAGGVTVGKIIDLNAPTSIATADAQFLAAAGRAILAGALLVAVLAVAVGALMARRIAAPLSSLTAAVARGGREPVPVTGGGEVRSLAQAFNAVIGRLQSNEQVRRTMVSDIAHELRTPLTVLSTHLENLGGSCNGEAAREVMSLQDEVLRMNRLVGDLQTLSLADAGALKLNLHETDLRALLARVIDLTEPVAAERGIRVELDAVSRCIARIDQDRIMQAVLNLVTNALRHTPDAGVITVGLTAATGEDLVISVADTGPGISADDLPLIFERFYRADPSRARIAVAGNDASSGGSGLGLAIVRGVVEAHGGTVTAENRAGGGAVFRIRLPRIESPNIG